MDPTVKASSEIPDQPSVYGPKKGISFLRGLLNSGNILDQPQELYCTEVSADGQPAGLQKMSFPTW